MKFLRIEKSPTNPKENVVLTIVNRRPGATLLNCDECHSIEVRAADLITSYDCSEPTVTILASDLGEMAAEEGIRVGDMVNIQEGPTLTLGTYQGL